MSLPIKKASRPLACVFALVIIFGLAGCGYKMAAETPSILGDGSKTLKVKGVDYPTMTPWMPYEIRSRLRDEINARHLARWVDSGPADFEIQINVTRYTSREWMRSEQDYAVLVSVNFTMEAIIYRGDTNEEVWRSGAINYSDTLDAADRTNERLASQDLITQTVRMLADKLRRTF